MATTFINKLVDESLLLDLKHLLLEAKQRVPPVLLALEDPADLATDEGAMGAGCSYVSSAGATDAAASACPPSFRAHNLTSLSLSSFPRGVAPPSVQCGGLGHRITACPKLEHQRKQMAGPKRDITRGGDW